MGEATDRVLQGLSCVHKTLDSNPSHGRRKESLLLQTTYIASRWSQPGSILELFLGVHFVNYACAAHIKWKHLVFPAPFEPAPQCVALANLKLCVE